MALLHEDLTERIIGIYHDVYTELGPGFLEKIYQRAMIIALTQAGFSVAQRVPYSVVFRGQLLGEFYVDVLVNGLVLLEIKATSSLQPWDDAQAINYLKASPLEVALLFNFGRKREHRRKILTNDRKSAAE